MFSLIITIVSIALVVALVAATMYSGGDTLTQGRTAADAAAFVTAGQQIGGAQVMHLSLTSVAATTVSGGAAGTDLVVDGYLASAPVVKQAASGGWVLDTADRLVTNIVSTDAICAQIDTEAGLDATKIAAKSITAADYANAPYGCDQSSKTFQFKY
jgi:hypothetical protein